MLAGTAALYALSLAVLAAPCWALFFVVAATAWPIWCYRHEHASFERRAILTGLTHQASRIRRWFWTGRLSGVLQTFAAAFWATLLLALASLLEPWQWTVLALDAVVLASLVRPVTAWLAREVRAGQCGLAARRWPLAWINVAILGIAFFVVDFHLIGAPDTRGLAWNEVAAAAFAAPSGEAACSAAGALVGGLAALDALAWHGAEILIPSLPNQRLKWAAWALFLLQAGVIAFTFTRLQLGLLAWLERRAPQPGAPAESSRPFLVAMGLLWMAAAGMALAIRDFDVSSLAARGRQAVAWADPCRTDPHAVAVLERNLDVRLQTLRRQEQNGAAERADAAIDALFAQAEAGVDDYLDWYFTVVGEYQRLGALLGGRFAESMRAELERHVFGEAFASRLEQASRDIAAQSRAQISAAAMELGADVRSAVDARPCLVGEIDLPAIGAIERDALRASAAALGGVGVATATRLLLRRAAAAATAKAASKRVFQGAASLAGRAATRRTGSTLVASAGGAAVCGPLAPLCALAAGAAAWIALDKALIEIDELRFREELRAEILESLNEQKAAMASELRRLHEAAIDQAVSALHQSVKRVFVPARDGL